MGKFLGSTIVKPIPDVFIYLGLGLVALNLAGFVMAQLPTWQQLDAQKQKGGVV
jgi:hypothetical protein